MEINITSQGAETTVQLVGRLDTPASLEVTPQLESLKDQAAGTIVLDCKELSYISSSGLRIFLTLRKASVEKGGKIIVRGLNSDVRGVFVMTGFLNLFQVEE